MIKVNKWNEEKTFQYYRSEKEEVPDHFNQFLKAVEALKGYESGAKAGRKKLFSILGCFGTNLKIGNGFHCNIGRNIYLGNNVSIGNNVVILDVGPVHIDDNVLIEDGVHIYNASHRVKDPDRWKSLRYSNIQIGSNVRIEKNSVLLPGTHIEDGVVIQEGAVIKGVVTHKNKITGNKYISELYDSLSNINWRYNSIECAGRINIPYLKNRHNIIKRPFYYRYGFNIKGGEVGFGFINTHSTFDDSYEITIGNYTFFGPGVNLITDLNFIENDILDKIHKCTGEFISNQCTTGSILIGDNVWVAGRVTILPGITIGNNSALLVPNGIVSKDVPENSVLYPFGIRTKE
jgi:maltose O-acetyltransferase